VGKTGLDHRAGHFRPLRIIAYCPRHQRIE
jgi:hypothetical protein